MAADSMDRLAPNVGSPDGGCRDGDFTLVEHPEYGKRGLAIRRVDDKERKTVWRWGGFLFATEADAEAFAQGELIFEGQGRPPYVRGVFSHKRVDGLRVYVHLGHVGAGW